MNNPTSLSLFFKGNDKEVFSLLYGDSHWSKVSGPLEVKFVFEKFGILPEELQQLSEEKKKFIGKDLSEEELASYWALEYSAKAASPLLWTISNWGVKRVDEILTYISNPIYDDESYLQVTFTNLIHLPTILLHKLVDFGLRFEAIWLNDSTRECGHFTTNAVEGNYFQKRSVSFREFRNAFETIHQVTLKDEMEVKVFALELKTVIDKLKDRLEDFIIDNPEKLWNDNRARLFFTETEFTKGLKKISYSIDALSSRNIFSLAEVWEMEYQCDLAYTLLMKAKREDIGIYYYPLLQRASYATIEIEKALLR